MEVRTQAKIGPDDLLGHAPLLTLDEVQREPDLIMAIKRAVDQQRRRQPGRFLLTGSANLLLMKRISETLAGRPSYVTNHHDIVVIGDVAAARIRCSSCARVIVRQQAFAAYRARCA